jgi:ketose-bisphosphate aldolase
MELLNIKQMLKDAEENHYAVGAFNFCNAETAKAIIDEGTRKRSPVMMISAAWEMDLVGPKAMIELIKFFGNETDVPICVHLDHATDIESVKRCIDAGFPSVMIDGSHTATFEENVELTKSVVDIAKPYGIAVEGELGSVGRVDDETQEGTDFSMLTDPEQAAEFVALTGIDALAVAIGNGHGMYPQAPELDFARLKLIREAVDIPLVLHGGSGTPVDQLHKAIEIGISKVNVASELARAYIGAIDNRQKNNWYSITLTQARDAVSAVTGRWMDILGCSNRIR